jgi:3-oxoacyl-[acyl-carrier protein] reductase
MEKKMLLKGKTAVITGCLQGIGRSTLDIFAENGANLFACAYQKTEEYESHLRELEKQYGIEVFPIYFDMLDNDAIKNAAREIQKAKRSIDILVNIAGITRDAIFHMVTNEQLQETFQVNFFSQILFSQYITKLMLKSGQGSVIFTSSISGIDGNHGQLAYASSKAALIAAAKTLSKELGPKGIRVNAIAPGVIKTPMTGVLSEELLDVKILKSDLGRIGTPSEVANLILFLASDLSAYITGQTIRVDGGIG